MLMKKRNLSLALGAAALGALALVGSASAQERNEISTEVSGSVLVFPKIIADSTTDTVIQIDNTGNPMAHAHCFYVNAAPRNPAFPAGPLNPPQWSETDFDIWLTRQQPTHWVASGGRRTQGEAFGQDGSGFDPGLIPPVPQGFRGELKCIQVDSAGAPFTGNKLMGKAILLDADGSDASSYNAIAIPGNSGLSGAQIGSDLELNLTDNSPGGEYAACPDVWIFNHYAHGTPDPALTSPDSINAAGCGVNGVNCPINTTLTMVPCSEDLENGVPGSVGISFVTYDEFESRLSAATTVDCFLDAPLSQISSAFTPGALGGSTTRHTRIRPNPGQGGVLAIAEETRLRGGESARAAYNLQFTGNRYDAATASNGDNDTPIPGVNATDVIVVPSE